MRGASAGPHYQEKLGLASAVHMDQQKHPTGRSPEP